jgi:hypothetical protein
MALSKTTDPLVPVHPLGGAKLAQSTVGFVYETTLTRSSGATCHTAELALDGTLLRESSYQIEVLMSGGSRSPPLPKASLKCHTFSNFVHVKFGQFWVLQLARVQPLNAFDSLQVIEPSERFQPSPTQPAAACGL